MSVGQQSMTDYLGWFLKGLCKLYGESSKLQKAHHIVLFLYYAERYFRVGRPKSPGPLDMALLVRKSGVLRALRH